MARHGPIAETKEETIMTRAAFYARYSSEGQREASIEDQYRNCERRAMQEGWTVIKRYKDQAISGAYDQRGRPGYRQMMADAEARRFDVLLVDDLSRLSRDLVETETVRRNFEFWGIRLVGVSDGMDTTMKSNGLLSAIRGAMNQEYLVDLAAKTHRGLAGQAIKGLNTGGRCFGYRHVPVCHATEKDEYGRPRIVAVKREIDPEQAKWVRQIFQWYADGSSPRWIAAELNRLGVPAPGAAYRRKVRPSYYGTWSASVLHGDPKAFTGLLNNVIYVGKLVWNRREWVRNPETKRKLPRLRPQDEWIEKECPDLGIVSDDVWKRVQARRRQHDGPKRGPGPKFLFSGLLKCGAPTADGQGECGASFVMSDGFRYGCASRLNRGTCSNDLRVSREKVEALLLAGVKQDLFMPEAYALFTREVSRRLAERQRAQEPEQASARRRLGKVEQEIGNVLTAIKQGILSPTVKGELQRLEAEKLRLQDQIAVGTKQTGQLVKLLPDAPARYRALVEKLGRLPERYVDGAREEIKRLVGDTIKVTPTAQGYLVAELRGNYAGLLKLVVGGEVKQFGCGGAILSLFNYPDSYPLAVKPFLTCGFGRCAG
ncbi:recombinase family protein [Nitrospiraceae bacterium AH_259_D15_M11_P09]|nr:recombinase family protein [Nitrospiraceae bacterium AH_259_D15_M11_P09]